MALAYCGKCGPRARRPPPSGHASADSRALPWPWDVAPGSPNEGGHYVPLIGRLSSGMLVCVSWGRLQLLTESFFQTFSDEAVAYVSTEDLVDQKSPDGFAYTDLIADLAALG